ncbi:MAG: hypothetical protein GY775_18975 [Candidatus Scalindua sp.]|nr:hypothetical protein [Candidatus Scalindua sp.]
MARDRSRILQNVVRRVRDWGRFTKTVKRSVSMQDAAIVPRANPAKQRVGCEVEKYRISYVSDATIISFDSLPTGRQVLACPPWRRMTSC